MPQICPPNRKKYRGGEVRSAAPGFNRRADATERMLERTAKEKAAIEARKAGGAGAGETKASSWRDMPVAERLAGARLSGCAVSSLCQRKRGTHFF